jgi:hypothetical protein
LNFYFYKKIYSTKNVELAMWVWVVWGKCGKMWKTITWGKRGKFVKRIVWKKLALKKCG